MKISSEIELRSSSQFTNINESNRYCEAKELFDSEYILSKTKDHQWRRIMLCLKVSNNKTNDYRTNQSLIKFIKLTISPIDKDAIPKLNKNCNVGNKSLTLN